MMEDSITEAMLATLSGSMKGDNGFQLGYLISFVDGLAKRHDEVASAIKDRIELNGGQW